MELGKGVEAYNDEQDDEGDLSAHNAPEDGQPHGSLLRGRSRPSTSNHITKRNLASPSISKCKQVEYKFFTPSVNVPVYKLDCDKMHQPSGFGFKKRHQAKTRKSSHDTVVHDDSEQPGLV